jgi:hypothetical protein
VGDVPKTPVAQAFRSPGDFMKKTRSDPAIVVLASVGALVANKGPVRAHVRGGEGGRPLYAYVPVFASTPAPGCAYLPSRGARS